MKIKMFAVLDKQPNAYMQPFFALTAGQAARMFGDLVADNNSQVSKHPEDYALFHVGEFDDQSGEVDGLANGPQPVARGRDFIPQA